MRALRRTGIIVGLAAMPALSCACLNDTETDRNERDFRSQYEPPDAHGDIIGAPDRGSYDPVAVAALLLGVLGLASGIPRVFPRRRSP